MVRRTEERDRESGIERLTDNRVGNIDPFEGAVADAEKRLLMGAAELRAKSQQFAREAEDLERRAKSLRKSFPAPEQFVTGSPRVSDWSKVDRATAMHEYMRQFPIGHRVKIADVVAALTQGGCDVAGKFRPDQKDYQKEAERNLFITASRNDDIYEYSTQTREIWRKE